MLQMRGDAKHNGKLLGQLLESSEELQRLALEAATINEAAEVLTDLHLAFWTILKCSAILSEDPKNVRAATCRINARHKLAKRLNELGQALEAVRVDGLRGKFG